MARRHRRHEEHDEHPSEAWLIAFADMMTLLMVTFLMMFAISNLDLQKFRDFEQAFAQGVGHNTHALPGQGSPTQGKAKDVSPGTTLPGTPTPSPSPLPPVPGPSKQVLSRKDLDQLKAKLEQEIKAAGLSKQVEVARERRGLVVYVTSGVLFDSAQADLTPSGQGLLSALAPVFATVGNNLIVEGHTDSRPIHTPQFPSNWELSSNRASAVARYLMGPVNLSPDRMSVAGYADTKPRDAGSSEAAYAKNRRVDIIVEAPDVTGAAAPAPGPS